MKPCESIAPSPCSRPRRREGPIEDLAERVAYCERLAEKALLRYRRWFHGEPLGVADEVVTRWPEVVDPYKLYLLVQSVTYWEASRHHVWRDSQRSGVRQPRTARRPMQPLPESGPPLRPSSGCKEVDERDAFEALLSRAEPQFRPALRLVFEDGLSYAEAARALGCSKPCVGQHVLKALSQIRKSFTCLKRSPA